MRNALLLVAVAVAILAVYLLVVRDDGRQRAAREAESPTESRPKPEQETPSEDPAPAASAKLRVRVDTSDERTVPVEVTIRGDGGTESVIDEVRSGFPTEIDIASLAESKSLRVRADHPDYLPAKTKASVGGDVVLRLVRAAVVNGRVLDANGAPRADVSVALFAMADGKPGDDPLAYADSDADGHYRLRAGAEGVHLVVVLEEDFLPAFAHVQLSVGRETEAAALVLAPGAAISGRVSVNGNAPDGQAVVRAVPRAEGHVFWHDNALWAGGAVHHADASGFSAKDGSYRIGGLVAGGHRMHLTALGAAHPDLLASVQARDVNAPATSINFDFTPASLLVRFAVQDPLPGAPRYWLRIVGEETFGMDTPKPAPVRMDVVPGAEYRIELEVEGRETVQRTVRAPAAGATLEVEIEPGPPLQLATLVLTLRAADGKPPSRAGVALFGDGGLREVTHDAEGKMELTDLPVGKFRLVVRPGGGWYGTASLWQGAETEIELRAGAVNRVTLDVARGGSARIVARSAAGRLLGARCRVLDARGQELAVEFVRDDGSASGHELLRRGGPSDVRPALPPGRYTLHFEHDGFHPVQQEVEIRLGERTKVEVTLKPH